MRKHLCKVAVAITAAAMMVAAMGVTAFADDTKETTVKYSVTEGYEWSVPTEIEFTQSTDTITTSGTTGKTQNVVVSNNVISNGKKLNISLNNPTFKIRSTEGATLDYTVSTANGTLSDTNTTVLEVAAGTNTADQALTFKLTKDGTEKAGNYTGTLSYVASIIAQ